MLLNKFRIAENPPGPADLIIYAEVIIKRDRKRYAVKIRKELKYSNGANFLKCMQEFHDLITHFYRECEHINEKHIPIPKGQFKDCRGDEIFDEVFILN